MTTTYDPHHSEYLDEADVRDELTRSFGVCGECRRCVDLCTTFPTLFDLIDRFDDRDPGRMTPAEQDRVVGRCFQCKLCAADCPYTPELHEWALDFPRLMLRAEAMRHANGHQSVHRQITTHVTARTDLVGRIGSMAAPVANRLVRAPAGSAVRKVIARTTGVSAVRPLPAFAERRFSTWMKRRTPRITATRQGSVVVFPTCLVEYHDVQVGKDLVAVHEHNGIECTVSGARCCGAPWLHAGDVERFTKVVNANVRTLAREVRAGALDVVVPEPSCADVLTEDYPVYCDAAHRADAALVADHVVDAATHLMRLHLADGTTLDTEFAGEVPERITYHPAGHRRASNAGPGSRDLLQLTGAEVTHVRRSAGIDGAWGLRIDNEQIAGVIEQQLADEIEQAGGGRCGDVVSGDSILANTAIAARTGTPSWHPLSVIARAYGLTTEPAPGPDVPRP